MTNLLQKHKLLYAIAGGFFVLVAIIAITSYFQSRTEASKQDLSTPELIGQAFDRMEITNEQRLLYLTYALYEYESLPSRFLSNVGWFGEMAQYELEVLYDPSVFCSMSPHARSEFQRLLKLDTTCEKETWTSILVGFLVIAIIAFVVNIQNRKSQKL